MIRTPEQLEAARQVWLKLELCERSEQEIETLAAWAARVQQDAFSAGRLDVLDGENVRAVLEKTRQDAVDEERKALRKLVVQIAGQGNEGEPYEYGQGRIITRTLILQAFDARSKPEGLDDENLRTWNESRSKS